MNTYDVLSLGDLVAPDDEYANHLASSSPAIWGPIDFFWVENKVGMIIKIQEDDRGDGIMNYYQIQGRYNKEWFDSEHVYALEVVNQIDEVR